MSDQPEREPELLDRAVEWLSRVMDSVGLNGRRVRWKWNQKRRSLAEFKLRSESMMRSAKAEHKMCPACRALVPRDAKDCPQCGVSLAAVKRPSAGRVASNMLPGVTAPTSLLMLLNGFWFVIMLMAQIKSGGGGGLGLFSAFDSELIVRFGSGLSQPRLLADGSVTGGEWWRLITPIFLHAGALHFFFNSYMLMNLGPIVEEVFGAKRFWVIYLASGISGAFLSESTRFVNTVGASGAIFGLIGLLLVYGLRHDGALGETMKSLLIRLMVYMLIISLLAGGMGIDHLNHLGGFIMGGLAALVVPAGTLNDRRSIAMWQGLAIAGVLLVLLAFYKVSTFS